MPPARSPGLLAIGDVLREVRHSRGFSQEELAARSGVHRAWLGKVEQARGNPSWTNLVAVLDALGVDVAEFGRLYDEARRRRERASGGRAATDD